VKSKYRIRKTKILVVVVVVVLVLKQEAHVWGADGRTIVQRISNLNLDDETIHSIQWLKIVSNDR
jgi:hypothetical protein